MPPAGTPLGKSFTCEQQNTSGIIESHIYIIAQCNDPHIIAEELILASA